VYDVLVIGAGFGGLAAALRLAERGKRVVVCEAQAYPGGCACTFERGGNRFEGGATLFSGLGERQLFRRWIERYDLDVEVDWLDPVVRFRSPGFDLDVPRDRAALIERIAALPGAPRQAVYSFFDEQGRVADLLWDLLDDPRLLPPLDLAGLLRHLPRLPRYLPLLRLVGQPLGRVLERHGLRDFAPLRLYLDALSQITLQCGVDEVESTFALGTMDYYFRGTGHVRGGIGTLAHGLVEAIRRCGGEVRFGARVRRLERDDAGWSTGPIRAREVVANILPQALAALTGAPPDPAHVRDVERGWGACMLYMVARDPGPPRHVQIVQDPRLPLIEGNHLFVSSGETITVSTHVRMDRAQDVPAVHARMREGVARFLPEWEIVEEFTASPRTFERWTGRTRGFVGGVPRRAGLHNYARFAGAPAAPGLHLVGDSVFPGQSTLATALGGYRLAERLAR